MSALAAQCNVSYITVPQTFELLTRFLSKMKVRTVNLDVAVCSCFLIVCKVYETWDKVRIEDLVNFCRGSVTREAIVEMEWIILESLDFEIVVEIESCIENFKRRFF